MKSNSALVPGSVIVVLVGMLWVWCTTKAPTKPEETVPAIKISVGEKGTKEAFFTGTPLTMIVELGDTIQYTPDAVSFHKGEATFLLPKIPEGTPTAELEYRFFWTVMPLGGQDSVTGTFFDTISARIGLEESNVVKVFVTNLPPEIRTLVVGDTTVPVSEHVYGDHVYAFHVDSIIHSESTSVPLELKVRDSDPDDAYRLFATWQPLVNEDLLYVESGPPTRGLEAAYRLPLTNFIDTIQVTLQDHHTHVVTHVVLFRTGGKASTHIDSIIVGGDSTYTSGFASMLYRTVSTSSKRLRLFTPAQNLTVEWTASHGTVRTVSDNNAPFAAVYACTSDGCTEPLTEDTTVVVDTVVAELTSNGGEVSTASIVFAKVPSNHSPEIDSILVDTVMLRNKNTNPFRYLAAVRDTLVLRAFYHDAESETENLTADWRSSTPGRIVEKPQQDIAVYACADEAYIDTLTIEVLDSLNFVVEKRLILTVTPRPIIDSIAVEDSVFHDMQKPVVYEASLGDTLMISGHAHSPRGGEIEMVFNCATEALSGKAGLTGLRYFALSDTLYRDTCAILVTDRADMHTEKEVWLNFVNYPPQIDSVVIMGVRNVSGSIPISFSSSAVLSATAGATLTFQLYASDKDQEVLQDEWDVSDPSRLGLLKKVSAFLVEYRCLEQFYTENLSLKITDGFGAEAFADIDVTINNWAPSLDSILVGDSVYLFQNGVDTTPLHRAPADSVLVLTDYADDRDTDDDLTVNYEFPNTGRARSLASGAAHSYAPLSDSAYVDTAVVTVEDQRGASATRRIIIQFVKQ
ncbi:MAG: hypothetical protein GF344_07335 [Chitinivibrionales bacterium]|nr:hypothetical protein [Chitinivibrionales bacterium]MBD3356722.1 hypothetical protein [Chitinivibrionales bacterium]